MPLVVGPELVPLETGTDGVARVRRTRVTLDTVVAAFRDGATAEEIAQRYPTLRLADVYSVVGYYLHHRGEVEEYLRERGNIAAGVRKENEACFDPVGVRERLISREHPAS